MCYESLITCISTAASLIIIQSLGFLFEQDMASLKKETKQFLILLLTILSFDSTCSQIVESAISKIQIHLSEYVICGAPSSKHLK
jgi:hypothetical protein